MANKAQSRAEDGTRGDMLGWRPQLPPLLAEQEVADYSNSIHIPQKRERAAAAEQAAVSGSRQRHKLLVM